MYVALAEALDCTLVTGDSRLAAAVDAGGAQCAVELLED
jgi:predicted nucleic acid-binding protein